MALTDFEKAICAFSWTVPTSASCIHSKNIVELKDKNIFTTYIFKSDRNRNFKGCIDYLKEHNIDYEIKYEAFANARNEVFRYAVQINLKI
jgi:hypothetical protein